MLLVSRESWMRSLSLWHWIRRKMSLSRKLHPSNIITCLRDEQEGSFHINHVDLSIQALDQSFARSCQKYSVLVRSNEIIDVPRDRHAIEESIRP